MDFPNRWSFALSEVFHKLQIPKDILHIIKDYTLIPPKEQFKSKYTEKIVFIPQSNDRTRLTWSYRSSDCPSCKSKDSFVEIAKYYENSLSIESTSRMCKICDDNIGFCGCANKDDEVCILDKRCHWCDSAICGHNIDMRYRSFHSLSFICRLCPISLRFGRDCASLILKQSKGDTTDDKFTKLYHHHFSVSNLQR